MSTTRAKTASGKSRGEPQSEQRKKTLRTPLFRLNTATTNRAILLKSVRKPQPLSPLRRLHHRIAFPDGHGRLRSAGLVFRARTAKRQLGRRVKTRATRLLV